MRVGCMVGRSRGVIMGIMIALCRFSICTVLSIRITNYSDF